MKKIIIIGTIYALGGLISAICLPINVFILKNILMPNFIFWWFEIGMVLTGLLPIIFKSTVFHKQNSNLKTPYVL